jgi:hypothetical protein
LIVCTGGEHKMHHVIHLGLEIAGEWTLFWSLLYALCPPREWFNSPRYDLFLKLVNFYGGINIRQVFMKGLYQASPGDAPPIPKEGMK